MHQKDPLFGEALIDEQGIAATDLGRLFIRNVAMTFDRHPRWDEESGHPVFSKSVWGAPR